MYLQYKPFSNQCGHHARSFNAGQSSSDRIFILPGRHPIRQHYKHRIISEYPMVLDEDKMHIERKPRPNNQDEPNYLPARAILDGKEDVSNLYWNSFLPIFFDRMTGLIRKEMTSVVAPYGITSAHSFYLIALKLIDGQTPKELSTFLDMDAANTNRVVNALTEKGYVTNDRATPTSKKFHIYLTERGKTLANLVMASTQLRMQEYFNDITSDEIA